MDGAPEVFVVAGEPSGDTHAARVLGELLQLVPGMRCRGFGGPKMAAAGCELMEDLASEAVMGLFPVVGALPRLLRLLARAGRELRDRPPSLLLLVDYPGFNMRLAATARRLGVPVAYYISPQVWAWARWRVRRLARLVDLMLVILPFEEEVYRASGLRTVFVGHPVMDHLRCGAPDPRVVARLREPEGRPLVALLPGSRRHVVRSLLPVFLDAAKRLRGMPGTAEARFVVALAQESFRRELEALAGSDLPLSVEVGRARDVIEAADLALTSSGTTTLEIAVCGTPFVIGYRVSPVLYCLGRLLVSVDHIGLVNLVAGRGLVPEHVGWRSFAQACAQDLHRLWTDPAARAAQCAGLDAVRGRLDTRGSYERAARELAGFLAPAPE